MKNKDIKVIFERVKKLQDIIDDLNRDVDFMSERIKDIKENPDNYGSWEIDRLPEYRARVSAFVTLIDELEELA